MAMCVVVSECEYRRTPRISPWAYTLVAVFWGAYTRVWAYTRGGAYTRVVLVRWDLGGLIRGGRGLFAEFYGITVPVLGD